METEYKNCTIYSSIALNDIRCN